MGRVNYPVRYLEGFDGPLQNGAQPRKGGGRRRMSWRPSAATSKALVLSPWGSCSYGRRSRRQGRIPVVGDRDKANKIGILFLQLTMSRLFASTAVQGTGTTDELRFELRHTENTYSTYNVRTSYCDYLYRYIYRTHGSGQGGRKYGGDRKRPTRKQLAAGGIENQLAIVPLCKVATVFFNRS